MKHLFLSTLTFIKLFKHFNLLKCFISSNKIYINKLALDQETEVDVEESIEIINLQFLLNTETQILCIDSNGILSLIEKK